MRWGGDFEHEWSLPHSFRADANSWCSYHNNSCGSNSVFWHYINLWKRSGRPLSMHSVKLGLHLVLLLEISSVCQSWLCHDEMVVLSPILWKILIANTSAVLVGQNKSYWTVVGNVLYMSGTQISIVLNVSKVHCLQQKSYQFSLNAICWVCIWFETSSACRSLFGHIWWLHWFVVWAWSIAKLRTPHLFHVQSEDK